MNNNKTSHAHNQRINPAGSPDDSFEVAISRGHDDKEGIVLEVLEVTANTISL